MEAIALVEDGDTITIDAETNSITLEISIKIARKKATMESAKFKSF